MSALVRPILLLLVLPWLQVCPAAERAAVAAPAGVAIAGIWTEGTEDGSNFVCFLPGGEFRFYEVRRVGAFELPADLMVLGKWRLEAGTVRLTEMTHEKFSEGPTEAVGRVDLRGDDLALVDRDSGETMHGKRSTWMPAPIPAGAVRKVYYDTVAGVGRLELVPEKSEGRPGERIAVRVTLTNTDSRAMFVPIRLADRVTLFAESLPDPDDTRIHLRIIDPPDVAPRILSVPLAAGAAISFDCTLVVPDKVGRLQLKAEVLENPRMPPAEVVFRVLPKAVP